MNGMRRLAFKSVPEATTRLAMLKRGEVDLAYLIDALALDRRSLNEAETLGASRLNGNLVPRTFEFAIPIEPHPYDPARAKQLLAEAGYPNRFDAGDRHPCVCIDAVYGKAASRLAQLVPSDGAYAYGSDPDVDALYRQQGREPDRKKREAMLRQIQQLVHERVRFAPLYDYVWPSAVSTRVEEAALMLIDPYPWSAPLEDVRLRKP